MVIWCSVRQYAYQDIRGFSKLVRGEPAYLEFFDNALVRTQEERAAQYGKTGRQNPHPASSYAGGIKKCNSFVAPGIMAGFFVIDACGGRAKNLAKLIFTTRLPGR